MALHYRAARAFLSSRLLSVLVYSIFGGIPLLAFAVLLLMRVDLTQTLFAGLPRWGGLLIGPVAGLLFSPLLCLLNVWRYRLQNPAAFGVRRFTIGLDGLESRGSEFYLWIDWTRVDRVVETSEFFLFYSGVATSHFIPKGFVAAPPDIEAIRAILRDTLSHRAKLLQ